MTTRILANVFLCYEDKILLLKRGLHKKMAPGYWAGVGGHVELEDIENPHALDLSKTCYRELAEEIGIKKADIQNLSLKYISVRKTEIEMRYTYHYFGETKIGFSLPHCDEGELHWLDKDRIFALPMTISVKAPLKHWLENPEDQALYLVAINKENTSATILEM